MTKFDCADPEFVASCYEEAEQWMDKTHADKFFEKPDDAIKGVAEYLANMEGCTILLARSWDDPDSK